MTLLHEFNNPWSHTIQDLAFVVYAVYCLSGTQRHRTTSNIGQKGHDMAVLRSTPHGMFMIMYSSSSGGGGVCGGGGVAGLLSTASVKLASD